MQEIIVFAEDFKTGISCGINVDGDLFLGSNDSGYNLPDTPENRTRIMADFEFYTNDEGSIFHGEF